MGMAFLTQMDWQSFGLGVLSGAVITFAVNFTFNIFSSNSSSVHQSGINAGGDVVGGNKNDPLK